MALMKFLTGFLPGLALAPGLCWLAFVYPHSGVSLRPAWWGLGVGLAAGLAAVAAFLCWFAAAWPGD